MPNNRSSFSLKFSWHGMVCVYHYHYKNCFLCFVESLKLEKCAAYEMVVEHRKSIWFRISKLKQNNNMQRNEEKKKKNCDTLIYSVNKVHSIGLNMRILKLIYNPFVFAVFFCFIFSFGYWMTRRIRKKGLWWQTEWRLFNQSIVCVFLIRWHAINSQSFQENFISWERQQLSFIRLQLNQCISKKMNHFHFYRFQRVFKLLYFFILNPLVCFFF